MQDIYNEIERDQLEAFWANVPMREAVRKVLLAGIYENGVIRKDKAVDPTRNAALALAWNNSYSDEQVGADLRSFAKAIMVVEGAFDHIKSFEKTLTKKAEKNPAR